MPSGDGTTITTRGTPATAGRHRVHQHRGRIRRGAAGHVEPDRIDRAPAPAEFDAERVGEALVLRQLPAVEQFDPVAGEFQRVERGGVASRHRGVDLGRGHAQAGSLDLEPVEFLRRLDQGGVAARGHVIDDGAGGALDIGRNLALGGEKRRKSLVEIGAASVEANGHGGFLRQRVGGLCSMARRPMAVNPLEPSFRDGPQDQTSGVPLHPGISRFPGAQGRT